MIEFIIYGVLGQSLRAIRGLCKIHRRGAEGELRHHRFFLPFVYSGLISGSVISYFFDSVTFLPIIGAIFMGCLVGKVLDIIGDNI